MSLIFFKYLCILNWMPATRFKHSGSGAAKDCKRCEKLQKHLFGSLHRWTSSLVTADSFMIGCRESFTSKDGVKHMIVQRRLLHVLRNTSSNSNKYMLFQGLRWNSPSEDPRIWPVTNKLILSDLSGNLRSPGPELKMLRISFSEKTESP